MFAEKTFQMMNSHGEPYYNAPSRIKTYINQLPTLTYDSMPATTAKKN
jgi:hypothetical protein